MAFTWYTVGLLEEFDFSTNVTQVVGSTTYARQAPYYALYFTGSNTVLRKTLPELSKEVWASQYMNLTRLDGAITTARLLAFRKADAVTDLAYINVDGATGTATAYVNGTAVGTFTMSVSAPFQLEVRLKIGSNAGVLQVWKNGDLVVDFTGNTGLDSLDIGCVFWQYSNSFNNHYVYLSDVIITSVGRIANKRPVIVPLTGPGDVSPPAFYDFIGNQVTTSNTILTVGRTYIQQQTFPFAGTIKTIMANFSTTGTCYLGICTRNASTSTKHTRRLVSNQLTVSATGIKTFVAGVDFPANWTVASGECLAIYTETAQIKSDGGTVDGNKYNTNASYYYVGNGLSGTTELTYSGGSGSFDCINAQYQVIDASKAYTESAIVEKLARKDFAETMRYAEFGAVNDEMLSTIGDLPIVCTGVKSIKVVARAISGTSLSNADWRLKIGTDDLATQAVIPTSMALKAVQFDGTWTPVDFNNAQIGFRVKA